jgi:hypothetical protein
MLRERARVIARTRFPGLMNRVRPLDPYPYYRHGVTLAAKEGKALGLSAISVIELGVAGGSGLVNLEETAASVSAAVGIDIQVVGFDLGSGMPHATDYRDLPYIWQPGFYKMDVPLLQARLTVAQLVLGDVAETIPDWVASAPPPVGFVAFDLDYYSSTKVAFDGLLTAGPDRLLPRTICYFDDIIGFEDELLCEYVGELLAIREFNDEHEMRKIAKINGFRYKIPPTHRRWPDQMFALHIFDHPDYTKYIYPDASRQLELD